MSKRQKMYPYFAYGSNLDQAGMEFRCPGSKRVQTATLADWRLTFRGVADIEPAEGREVLGAVWLVSDDGIRALDRYEGAPSFYEQRFVEVALEDGSTMRAMTYVMTFRQHGQIGLPSQGYYDTIARGFQWWNLDMDVLNRAVQEVRDAHEADERISHYRERGTKRLMAVMKPGHAGPSEAERRRGRRARKAAKRIDHTGTEMPTAGMSPATDRLARLEAKAARKNLKAAQERDAIAREHYVAEQGIEGDGTMTQDEIDLEREFDRDMGILYGRVIA